MFVMAVAVARMAEAAPARRVQSGPVDAASARRQALEPCVPPAPGKDLPFSVGERVEMALDAFGAGVGALILTVAPGRKTSALTFTGRGHTDLLGRPVAVSGTGESHVGRNLEERSYDENTTEDGIHRSESVTFPPRQGGLEVHGALEGNASTLTLRAPPETRDILSTLYLLCSLPRGQRDRVLRSGFGARRMWFLRGSVVGRESVTTPAGQYKTIHLSGLPCRPEGSHAKYEVHAWLWTTATGFPLRRSE